MLSLSGGPAYDRVHASGDLTIEAGASLVAPEVVFAKDSNRFTILTTFADSVDGGAGTDTIAVSEGSQAAPAAFGRFQCGCLYNVGRLCDGVGYGRVR